MSEKEIKKKCKKALRLQTMLGPGASLLVLVSWLIGSEAMMDPCLCLIPICFPLCVAGIRGRLVFYY